MRNHKPIARAIVGVDGKPIRKVEVPPARFVGFEVNHKKEFIVVVVQSYMKTPQGAVPLVTKVVLSFVDARDFSDKIRQVMVPPPIEPDEESGNGQNAIEEG